MYQPKLGIYGHNRCNLWTQIIKTEVYKEAIKLYGEERMKLYINFMEDCIMNNIIYQVATSGKVLLKFGYIHINRMSSSSRGDNIVNKAKFGMFYLESKYEFSKYAKEKKETTIMKLNHLIRRTRFKVVLKDEKIKLYLKKLVKRIYNDKNITSLVRVILLNTSLYIGVINSTKELI